MTISHDAPSTNVRVNIASVERTIFETMRPGVAMPARATLVVHVAALTANVKALLPAVPRDHRAYERAQGLVLPRARPGEQASHYELWQYSLALARAAQELLDLVTRDTGPP
ncbi:hypothetical protein [Streptomyces aureocirculatus]|uniref:hypothetical protein n=1 Tax=Streptomyces aureocirculatus TaxID=67275 RepID=UPI0004C54060|nr:hypothetical protein [Streptomyces aureocirculatus]